MTQKVVGKDATRALISRKKLSKTGKNNVHDGPCYMASIESVKFKQRHH